jgi:hypothetical protein
MRWIKPKDSTSSSSGTKSTSTMMIEKRVSRWNTGFNLTLTRLNARENVIAFIRRESFKSYIKPKETSNRISGHRSAVQSRDLLNSKQELNYSRATSASSQTLRSNYLLFTNTVSLETLVKLWTETLLHNRIIDLHHIVKSRVRYHSDRLAWFSRNLRTVAHFPPQFTFCGLDFWRIVQCVFQNHSYRLIGHILVTCWQYNFRGQVTVTHQLRLLSQLHITRGSHVVLLKTLMWASYFFLKHSLQ